MEGLRLSGSYPLDFLQSIDTMKGKATNINLDMKLNKMRICLLAAVQTQNRLNFLGVLADVRPLWFNKLFCLDRVIGKSFLGVKSQSPKCFSLNMVITKELSSLR